MESMQGNTEDHLHAAQTTIEIDGLDDDLPSESLFQDSLDDDLPFESLFQDLLDNDLPYESLFQDLLDDDLGLPAEAKFRCCSINIKRSDFQDEFHAAQPTNEEDDGDIVIRRSRRGNGLAPRRIRLSARHPSFERLDRQRTSPERNDFQRGGIITRESVPGQKKVVVRPRTSIVQTNDHSIQVCLERDEEIDEEEAVCKFCFDILKEDENILKTECCEKPRLIHEACAANQSRGNNTCDSCGQEFRSFPVTLLRELGSAQRMDTQESNKQSYFSWLIRLMVQSQDNLCPGKICCCET
ncbi:uncharacterized protein LOC130783054 isoform X1 [Actinidia eriantha]|uniref:uncharacterized protein LOC130783054 isoform X1 n=1 Tax=Actinidia eriantha TaxID=165200 RepID=UPI0025894BBE|nr:uncharacterized protein LOC130783054 isoform X1 [Actinidia eriantha]